MIRRRATKKLAQFGAVASLCGALLVGGAPAARAADPAPSNPPEVSISIRPDKKNVRPGQSVTFTVTVTHPGFLNLGYRGAMPWGPLWYESWPGITNNTCRDMSTDKPGTQTCHFTVTPNLGKGEELTTTFSGLQKWVEPYQGIKSRRVEASTTIRGVGGGNR